MSYPPHQQPDGWQQPGYPAQPGAQGYPPPGPAYPPVGVPPQPGPYPPNNFPNPYSPGPYPPAPAARRFRPIRTLGLWALILAAIYTGVFAIGAALSPAAAGEYKWALDVGALDEILTPYDYLTLLALVFLVPAAIVGMVWLWRARENTLVLDPGARHERGRVWVILGWIVPIVSLWFPYQVVRDVVRNSVRSPLRNVLGLWWAAWLVALIAGNVADQQVDTVFGTPTEAGLTALPFLAILAAIGNIVAVIFWARILLTVSRDQHERVARPPQPTWAPRY